MEEYTSTNIHLDWLKNIHNQLMKIQEMERMAREGCVNLIEYLQTPMNSRAIVIPEARYKNFCFMAMELDILISNLSSVLSEDYKVYKKDINLVLKNIYNRNLFIREKRVHGDINSIEVLPFLNTSTNILISIKSSLIKDIGHLLYLPEEQKVKW